MVDIAAGLVFRAGDDQQDADGGGGEGLAFSRCRVLVLRARQAAADPGRAGALEEESLAVVEQFPGEGQQGGIRSRGVPPRGLAGGTPALLYRKASPGMGVSGGPGAQDLPGLRGRQCGLVECLAPFDQALLDPACPVLEIGARPDGVFLQIPTQFLGLDGA
nr:hypothetical protein [Candidatus Thiodictyon syntrophicum]